jgi:hypothetical protein
MSDAPDAIRPIRKNRWRSPASTVLCVVGVCYYLLLDGQLFTNSLVFLACWTTSVVLWFPELWKERFGLSGRVMRVLGFHLVAIIFVSLGLRHCYEFQKKFNERVAAARTAHSESAKKDNER